MTLEKIAFLSDTHLGCQAERLDLLNESYKFAYNERGVTQFYHAGDISDGQKVYRGQEYFLKCLGCHDQAEYVAEHYPNIKGTTTYFITGNHDMKHFDVDGADIGKIIASMRPDMDYLGQYYARVRFGNAKMDLVHPAGGFAYAISYPLQKYINELEGGSKADILVMGHFHRTMYTVYRNIHAIMPGAFQDQNDFTRRRGLQPNKGFWIVEFEHDSKGTITSMTPEWRGYYELKDDRMVRQMSKNFDEKKHPKNKKKAKKKRTKKK